MNQSNITDEMINIEINSAFYIPGELIKGIIKMNKPKIFKNLDTGVYRININLKLIQYEFWEYSNEKIEEFKNIYKTEIKTKTIEYILENIIINNDPKTENEALISIPFEFKIEENDNKLLPTFQFEDKIYFLGIRHILEIDCKELKSKNYH